VRGITSDAGIWQIAAYMIAQDGAVAEREIIKLANLMLIHGDRERQGRMPTGTDGDYPASGKSAVAAPVMATADWRRSDTQRRTNQPS
jgi:hypothetical protein